MFLFFFSSVSVLRFTNPLSDLESRILQLPVASPQKIKTTNFQNSCTKNYILVSNDFIPTNPNTSPSMVFFSSYHRTSTSKLPFCSCTTARVEKFSQLPIFTHHTMFGAFRSSLVAYGGYLWKKAPRLSQPQKQRLRRRMQLVDHNIEVLYQSLKQDNSVSTGYKKIDALKFEFPKENEMSPRDKYTTFDKKVRGYRKSVHFVPKWTKKSFRENPKYF
ncbi:hypothetical protein SBP28_002054 [Candidozyma auris]